MVQPIRGVRLAELAGALSLACDVGHGASYEHGLRTAVVAARLAEAAGLEEMDGQDAFHFALVRWVGCTATSAVLAGWFGDDIAAHQRAATFDGPLDPLLEIMRHAGAGRPVLERARTLAGALAGGPGAVFGPACEAGRELAVRLGCRDAVGEAVANGFERWDGRGWPGRASGDAVPIAVRVVQIAEDVEHVSTEGGEGAAALVARRGGRQYDPALAAAFCRKVPGLLADLRGQNAWDLALVSEPGPPPVVLWAELDEALLAFADFADLKSSWMTGHSRGVAALAEGAARRLGLPSEDAVRARRAGLVHDLGRVAVPNSVWDEPGPLNSDAWEQVRLHPYHTDRFLARAEALAELGRLGARHHERLDGSGYHVGLTATQLPPLARVLAAADAVRAMTEPRPHRPLLGLDRAAQRVRAEVKAGRLDGEAFEAVLDAAGHASGTRERARVAGLTPREVEVLRLLALGLSNRAIGQRLVVSPRTVGHHIAHIYDKAGMTTRAGATLFAMRHGLAEPDRER